MNDGPLATGPVPGNLTRRGGSYARYLWVVGLGLFIGLVWFIGWRKVRHALASVNLELIALMMACDLATLWFRALKWRYALADNRQAVALFFLSKGAGNWSPGRLGELSPLLLREHRNPRVAAWIVVDRLLEMSATLLLGAIGLFGLRIPDARLMLALLAAACALIGLPVFVLTRRALFPWLAGRLREGSALQRATTFAASIQQEVAALGRKVPALSIMTVLATCIDLVAGILMLASFGHLISFQLAATVQCAHALASAIPLTPSATGIPYVPAAVLLKEVGHVPYEVVVAAVALRLVGVNLVFWTSFVPGANKLWKRTP